MSGQKEVEKVTSDVSSPIAPPPADSAASAAELARLQKQTD
jgi:hypothetical protein